MKKLLMACGAACLLIFPAPAQSGSKSTLSVDMNVNCRALTVVVHESAHKDGDWFRVSANCSAVYIVLDVSGTKVGTVKTNRFKSIDFKPQFATHTEASGTVTLEADPPAFSAAGRKYQLVMSEFTNIVAANGATGVKIQPRSIRSNGAFISH